MPKMRGDGRSIGQNKILLEAVNLCFEADAELGNGVTRLLELRRGNVSRTMHFGLRTETMMTALRMLIHLVQEIGDDRAQRLNRCIDVVVEHIERVSRSPRGLR
jgi:hypothetical protein